MSKHTKGPWSIAYETDITGIENDPENECVGMVDVAHVYMRTVPGRTDANARLIAAAPDLLGALQMLLATSGEINEAPNGLLEMALDSDDQETRNQANAHLCARAAIARATMEDT